MPYPRKQIYTSGEEATFHVYCHSVHPTGFFMRQPGQSLPDDHRKTWVVERLAFLCRYFAIKVFTYAVLDNHYHLVVRVVPRLLDSLDDTAILDRWLQVYPGRRNSKGEPIPLESEERRRRLDDKSLMASYREKLGDLSAFMKALNQNIARRVFHEQKYLDKDERIDGHFFNRRFQCKRVTESKGGLLGVMLYVDLNETRAGIVTKPEEGRFSGITRRIAECGRLHTDQRLLVPIDEVIDRGADSLSIYLQILDTAGRAPRQDKASIDPDLDPILERLDLNRDLWVEHVRHFPDLFHRVIGPPAEVRALGVSLGRRFRAGKLAAGVFDP